MAEIDLAAYLTRTADERVLWQGRALVGARWPSWPRLAVAAGVWLLVLSQTRSLLRLQAGPLGPWLATLALGVVALGGPAVLVMGASKLVGPSYRALTIAAIAGSALALSWMDDVRAHGVEGALGRLSTGTFVAALLFVGLPLAVIVERLTWRLGSVYVITDRQVGALYTREGGRPWLLWVEPLRDREQRLRLRLERDWRCPEGWLAIGERELDVRGEEAARALREVEATRRSGQDPLDPLSCPS